MTAYTVTIDAAVYDQMVSEVTADFAAVEPNVHGAVKRHVRNIHAWALGLRNAVEAQNGLVHAEDGDSDKPPPKP